MSSVPLQPGDRVGNYVLQEEVGNGAFGHVWKAVHHERPGRVVGLKIATDPAFRKQLSREGRLPDIKHRNVVPILDCDTRSDHAYVVMPFYAAGSLADLIARHPHGLPEGRVEALLKDILAGLSAAHQQGIVHRDIKPANILLGEAGQALVADFGLSFHEPAPDGAQLLAPSISRLNELSGALAGTLAYMAPEVLGGAAATKGSDVYSVGLLLFEMLTGRRWGGLELPSQVRPDLRRTAHFDGLFYWACRPVAERYPDAEAMSRSVESGPEEFPWAYGRSEATALGRMATEKPAKESPTPWSSERWNDLWQALEFAQKRGVEWMEAKVLRPDQWEAIRTDYEQRRQQWAATQAEGREVPGGMELTAGRCGESRTARSLRYLIYMEKEIRRFLDQNWISLAQYHSLLTGVRGYQAVQQRRLASEGMPEVPPTESTAQAAEPGAAPAVRAVPPPRRSLLDILLAVQNIQMLLAFGGALIVAGLVILLWVNEYFTPRVVAASLGVVNVALLGGGWWTLRSTRYQLAGRALTLLACLVMPLNLWYYHANQLITLDGQLWVAALLTSALYATSALVLRDELFVYIFAAGVTLTGLLILAGLPPSPERFWEIASPATLLVVLGLLGIHVERAFPEHDGPFGRKRFGLAFFWSGHALLAAGLLLILGAEITGDWLYQPVFRAMYERLEAMPSPIVGELRGLALALVVAGTYAYIYSDLVVRHAGVYVHIAAGTLMWTLVLGLQYLNIAVGLDALIAVLAVTALVTNVSQAALLRDTRTTRAFPIFGLLLLLLAVALGLLVYLRALSLDLRSVWQVEPPAWTYVGAMLLTGVSCRVGAYLYQSKRSRLGAVYFFATAAATLVAATACLAALGLTTWQEHAPLLMLLPIAYLVASRLYRDRPEEPALVWVSHAATVVMLASSLVSALEGFAVVQQKPLNLVLALFCAEAVVFYVLATVFRRQVWTIHLGAVMACGSVWQVLTYWGVAAEFYTLTFALCGLGLLVAYRFAMLERFSAGPLANAAFQSANTLLSLSFVAALFLGLSHLATGRIQWGLVGLFALLAAAALLSVVLVREAAWRRWYVVMTIGQTALTFLGVTVLSELSLWQKLEIFSVAVGLLLLVAGHVGWYREQDRQSDLVSVSVFLGSLLVGVPLAVATLIDRSRDHLIILNELGFLAAGVLLVTTGFLFKLKSTTLTGAALTGLYFVTLVIFVPWSRLNVVGVFIMVGGGTLFLLGLLLSVYRDRVLALPERIKKREGLFRVLNWR